MHLLRLLISAPLLLRSTASHAIPAPAANSKYDLPQHILQGADIASPRQKPLPFGHHPKNGFQTGFVALGDSYSAGIGTGFEGKEDDCRHGLGAYPRLIANDLAASQGGRNNTAAQLLSCTGATTQEVLSGGETSQIDSFNTSLPADFGLLSLGGNDLGFFEVMNSCVFRFYSFYSGTCETALERARVQIESDEFAVKLAITIMEILDKVRWEKKPWFFITMTGYARFFNDATEVCDDMSFGVWWNGPKLTRELRISMNQLVVAVNAKIRATVDMINSRFTTDKVLFVDYDDLFEGHRFCEPNVTEPDYERTDTWFFLVGGIDNARNSTNNETSSGFITTTAIPARSKKLIGTASGADLVDPSTCLEPARRSGDWDAQALCYMAMAKARDPTLRLSPAMERKAAAAAAAAEKPATGATGDDQPLFAENSMWYVPTYYGKTFHPRTLGHEAIRDAVYRAWRRLE